MGEAWGAHAPAHVVAPPNVTAGAAVIELGADVTPACWPRLTWAARQLNVSA
jgi:hypothetical protein